MVQLEIIFSVTIENSGGFHTCALDDNDARETLLELRFFLKYLLQNDESDADYAGKIIETVELFNNVHRREHFTQNDIDTISIVGTLVRRRIAYVEKIIRCIEGDALIGYYKADVCRLFTALKIINTLSGRGLNNEYHSFAS